MATGIDSTIVDLLSQAEDLPTMPAAAVEVLTLSEDEDATISDLAGAISRDPALASKLLKVSNSSMFNMGAEITSLERATMVLGLKTVKLMSLAFALVDSLPEETPGAFDLKEYWKRSVVCAVAARTLANELNPLVADEAFLVGLLSRIGQLVMAHSFPLKYTKVLTKAGDTWPTREIEQDQLGFDYCAIGRVLLQKWQMPALICECIGALGDPAALPDGADDAMMEIARISHMATLVEDLVCSAEKSLPIDQLSACAHDYYKLDGDKVDALLERVEKPINETAEMMNIELDEPVDIQDTLRCAQVQLVKETMGIAMQIRAAEQRADHLATENKELSSKATTDALTGIPNRAAFDETLARCVEEVKTQGKALGLLIIDVDHFKAFNDRHGHQVGDDVLKLVAQAIASQTRGSDLAARYGGEEFGVILGGANMEGVTRAAERIRRAIAAQSMPSASGELQVTASVGGASTTGLPDEGGAELLIAAADRYLYKAKESGRNCCRIFPRPTLVAS